MSALEERQRVVGCMLAWIRKGVLDVKGRSGSEVGMMNT